VISITKINNVVSLRLLGRTGNWTPAPHGLLWLRGNQIPGSSGVD